MKQNFASTLYGVQGAVAKLELAKAEEDASPYMEPPRLWQPIRHCLGFVHLNATGDHAAAEKVRSPAPLPEADRCELSACVCDIVLYGNRAPHRKMILHANL